jgi:hypothetical protein
LLRFECLLERTFPLEDRNETKIESNVFIGKRDTDQWITREKCVTKENKNVMGPSLEWINWTNPVDGLIRCRDWHSKADTN